VTAVLAYLVLFLAVMLAVQYGLRALEERLFAWRG
jgi:ABC-type nitrate/sulfonate/bicarbonate transport system permease component